MTFLHPMLALAGVACIAIPIIIHFLMRRRRRPIQWAAMRFLLEAYKKHRRRLRLEQLILLATRCLLIALIAVALGRPLLSSAGLLAGSGATTVYLVLDNSLTASAIDTSGEETLVRHKRLADAILARLDAAAGDRAGLVLLGGPADPVVVPASNDIAGVRSLIAEATATESRADIAGAVAALRSHLSSEDQAGTGRHMVVLLSDFLEGSVMTDAALTSLSESDDVIFIASRPASEGVGNVSITRVEPLRAVMLAESGVTSEVARQEQVTVHLERSGPGVSLPEVTNVRVRLVGEDGAAGQVQQAVSWRPGETRARASVMAGGALPAGRGVIIAEIDRDAIAGDNIHRRVIEVRPRLRVAIVAPRQVGLSAGLDPLSSADWIRLALQPGSGDSRMWAPAEGEDIEVVGIEPGAIDAARLAGLDAAIVAAADLVTNDGWRRLALMVEAGGLVIVLPPSREAAPLWADQMLAAMQLEWTVAREVQSWPQGAGLSAGSVEQDASGLLSLVSSELEDLVKPVRVWRSIPIAAPAPAETVLRLADGSPWVIAGAPEGGGGRGLVVLMGSSLSAEWTDLAGRPLFVPLMHEMLRQGIGRAQGSYSGLAGSRVSVPARTVELRFVERAWSVTREGGGLQEAVGVDAEGHTAVPLRRAGLWNAVDARGGDRGLVAINADLAAGKTDAVPPTRVAAWLAGVAGDVRWLAEAQTPDATPGEGDVLTPATMLHDPQRDSPMSLPLLQAALAIALLELLLARLFSHADARSLRAASRGPSASLSEAAA